MSAAADRVFKTLRTAHRRKGHKLWVGTVGMIDVGDLYNLVSDVRSAEELRTGMRAIGQVRCLTEFDEVITAVRAELAADEKRRKAVRRG